VRWKRGFFRLWMAVSALWIIFIIAVVGPSDWDELSLALGLRGFALPSELDNVRNPAEIIITFILEILILPLFLVAIGIMVAWVARGFRSSDVSE
jgi:hypothetical protein